MKKTFTFNRSFLLLLVTLLFIGTSIPAWASRNQTPQAVSATGVQPQQEQEIVTNQPNQSRMEEEFQRQLMEMEASPSISIEQDLPRELVEQPFQIPDALPESMAEGNMNHDDRVALLKNQAQERRNKRLFQKDQFNYQQKDVEELMLKGVPLEDIYLSDQIGNEWLTDPRALLEQKEKKKITWTVLEAEIEKQVDQELSGLILTMRTKNDQLNKQVPNKAERLVILKQMKESRELSVDQVMDIYKGNGQEGLKQLRERVERGSSHE